MIATINQDNLQLRLLKKPKSHVTLSFLMVLIATLIFCSQAFKNKFPILAKYSGQYLYSSINEDSNLGLYSLFVAITSMNVSLWLTILIQSGVFSLVLYYFFFYFVNGKHYLTLYAGFVFFISAMLSVSIITSTVSPVIFAMTSALCTILLLDPAQKKKTHLVIICIILITSSIMDIAFLISQFLLIIILIFRQVILKENVRKFSFKNLMYSLLCSLACYSLFISINYSKHSQLRHWHNFSINQIWDVGNQNTIRDFVYRIGRVHKHRFSSPLEQKSIDSPFRKSFAADHREYEISFQSRNRLAFHYIYLTELIFFIVIVVSCVSFFLTGKDQKNLVIFLFLIVILQQLSMAVVHNREILFNSIWLMLLPLLIYMVNKISRLERGSFEK